jgi:sugar phosphate permease
MAEAQAGGDGTPQARAASRRATFALTWLAYASYYIGRKGFSIVKVRLSGELGLAAPSLALIDTAYLVAYALGQVPSGLTADRAGPRRLIGYGMLASACACAAFGSVSSFGLLMLAFACNGFAQSTGWPGTTRAMAEHTTPADRGRVMGLWSTCYQVGGIAASALATWLLAHYGWRAAFRVPALWLALVGALILLRLADVRANAAEPDASQSTALHASRALLSDPRVYGYGACYFCLKLIRYSLLFWLPYYLHTVVGFDDVRSGYLSTSFEVGGVAGSIGLGYASDRVGRARSVLAFASLLGLAAALLFYARLGSASAGVHFAAMALVGALLFGPDSLLSGAAAQDLGGTRAAATAVGMVNGMGSVGALLQGALTIGVQQAFGWNALFYAFFGLALLGALCLAPTLRERRSLAF